MKIDDIPEQVLIAKATGGYSDAEIRLFLNDKTTDAKTIQEYYNASCLVKAHDQMMQLFVFGPTWDGNLISKAERDLLYRLGYIDRFNGWQWLNRKGMEIALNVDVSDWKDQRWHNKQKCK